MVPFIQLVNISFCSPPCYLYLSLDELAGQQPRLPRHRHLPDDVRGHRQQSNAEVGQGEVHDEEVHPGAAGSGGELGDEDQAVPGHDHSQQQAEEHQLLRLKY